MKTHLHNLSHRKLLSANMGELIPIMWTPAYPGDHFQHSTSALIRTQPLLAPLMHMVKAKIFHFFVPNRILWDDWEDFITGGPDGLNASVHPYVTFLPGSEETEINSLYDYLGLPPTAGTDAALTVNALPYRAYNLIFNQYFRDQDLVDPVTVSTASGADITTNLQLLRPAWKKDYFTIARPEPMKGPEITVPVRGSGEIVPDGVSAPTFRNSNDAGQVSTLAFSSGTVNTNWAGGAASSSGAGMWEDPNLIVDDESGQFVDALDFREAFAQLRFQELRSRFGSEYVDYLAFLGVRSSDARLRRAEYLGGGSTPVQFSEVLQTAPEDIDNPVGALKGHGISAKRTNRYRRYFEEHGIVMSLMYVMPEPVYAQGIWRPWSVKTKEDYWQPEYEHIGQQAVLNKEVYATVPFASADTLDEVFGWVDRYEELRHMPSTISGEFRNTLNYWTMARLFEDAPALNEDFVTANPTNRIFPAQTAAQLYVMINHNLKARRKITNNPKGYIY